MKALSVRQPWALEINDGVKNLEFRTWKTDYRGPLLICASSHDSVLWVTVEARNEQGEDIEETLPLPTGCAMCVVDLKNIRPMTKQDADDYKIEYHPELWAWELELLYSVQPVPIKGRLHLFEVTEAEMPPALEEGEVWWMFEYPNINKKKPAEFEAV